MRLAALLALVVALALPGCAGRERRHKCVELPNGLVECNEAR
ncbi:MAG: hypothetical protein AB7S80_00275 [Rhizobiaceae bacterium]